jgi:hypothetical protein
LLKRSCGCGELLDRRRGRARQAANLCFQLVSARYERASLIVTSNKPFGRWGKTFGDDIVAAAMMDRLVHHADVVALKDDSYRLKDRDLGHVLAGNHRRSSRTPGRHGSDIGDYLGGSDRA